MICRKAGDSRFLAKILKIQLDVTFLFFDILTLFLLLLATNLYSLGLVMKKRPKSIWIVNIQGGAYKPRLPPHNSFVFKGPHYKGLSQISYMHVNYP